MGRKLKLLGGFSSVCPRTILLKICLRHDILEFYRYPGSNLAAYPSGWVFAWIEVVDILASTPQLLRAGSNVVSPFLYQDASKQETRVGKGLGTPLFSSWIS